MDITGYLGDNSTVTVTRSVRDASGTFVVRFADQPNRNFQQTMYRLIEPMDMIIIRMSHDPAKTGGSPDDPLTPYGGGSNIPLIIRGMVTTINRNETMTDMGPQRWVTVTGHDQMKILQVFRINYFYGLNSGMWTEINFKFAHVYAPNMMRKNKNANMFLQDVLDEVINPFIKTMSDLNKVVDGVPMLKPWLGKFSLPEDDNICPDTLSRFDDQTLYDVLKSVLDVGIFNELYLEEDEKNTYLVARPAPFKDIEGNFIQGTALSLDIPSKDIVSIDVGRSDAEACNYFWISLFYDKKYNADQMAAAIDGKNKGWMTGDWINSRKELLSWRKMEVGVQMTPFVVTDDDASLKVPFRRHTIDYVQWLCDKRVALAEMNKNEMVFEKGTLRLRGNHNIKAGMYLRILRGPLQIFDGEVYAHTITHEFNVMNGFFTTIQFDRGTVFSNWYFGTGQKATWIDEIEAQSNMPGY